MSWFVARVVMFFKLYLLLLADTFSCSYGVLQDAHVQTGSHSAEAKYRIGMISGLTILAALLAAVAFAVWRKYKAGKTESPKTQYVTESKAAGQVLLLLLQLFVVTVVE